MPDDGWVWRMSSLLLRSHHIPHGVAYGGRGDIPNRTAGPRPARPSNCPPARMYGVLRRLAASFCGVLQRSGRQYTVTTPFCGVVRRSATM